jgi:hypothetical protein
LALLWQILIWVIIMTDKLILATFRKFGGKPYHLKHYSFKKADVVHWQKKYKSTGYNARILKFKRPGGYKYAVYARLKNTRHGDVV